MFPEIFTADFLRLKQIITRNHSSRDFLGVKFSFGFTAC
jgi:hypothetical protein